MRFLSVCVAMIVLLSGLLMIACDGDENSATELTNQGENLVPSNEPMSSTYRPAQTETLAETSTPSETSPEATKTLLSLTYRIVDTGQTTCYDNSTAIVAPQEGEAFYGQDAQVVGNQPSYATSADGLTVYDNVTGLTWTQGADWTGDGVVNVDDKFTYDGAQSYVDTLNAQNYGGYSDWRVPSIKELYSLIDYNGTDPNPAAADSSGQTPFINDDVFEFAYGDTDAGERIIDSQWVTSTLYVSTVMNNQTAMFGVNFGDGRIKGYPVEKMPGQSEGKLFYARFCRGNTGYGQNNFVDNDDGTITDEATGLMWSQSDSGEGMNWEDALAWVQEMNDGNYLGYSDWRLPNAKELQSLVDYSRSPDTTGSAAIDPLFESSEITDEAGKKDYPFYWSSTTFSGGSSAVYVSFGEGLGSMDNVNVIDVHGAGCQRSDPKTGDPDDYPSWGHGPQGDVQRVFNYVRLVRGDSVEFTTNTDAPTATDSSDSSLPMQNDLPGGSPPAGGTPPQEAIDACDGTCTGCECQFETPRGIVEGTCQTIQGQSVCVPQGGPPQ